MLGSVVIGGDLPTILVAVLVVLAIVWLIRHL